MFKENDTKDTRVAIWFSSILRWALGTLFIGLGLYYHADNSSWIIMLFGLVFIATGFFRPKRCIEDNCDVK